MNYTNLPRCLVFFPLDASVGSCHDLSNLLNLSRFIMNLIILMYVYTCLTHDCACMNCFIHKTVEWLSDGSTEELLFDPMTRFERQQSRHVSNSALTLP